MEYLVPRDQAFDLFQRAGRRVERILSALPGHGVRADTPIPHMDWSVGDLTLHLVQGLEVARKLQDGESSPYTDMQQISEVNARLLAGHPERDIQLLLRQFSTNVRQIEQRFREMPEDFRVPFHAGTSFTPAQAMAMMSSELLMHGWDLAQIIDEEFEIDAADARLILYTITPMMSRMVLADAAAGLTATYEIRIRDGACFRLYFENRELYVSHVEPGGPADCRITADATAFLLMGYGRGSQITPILTGKIRAGGRKPWLAVKFPSLIKNP